MGELHKAPQRCVERAVYLVVKYLSLTHTQLGSVRFCHYLRVHAPSMIETAQVQVMFYISKIIRLQDWRGLDELEAFADCETNVSGSREIRHMSRNPLT